MAIKTLFVNTIEESKVASKVTQDGDPVTDVTTSNGFEDSDRSSEGNYSITFAAGTFAITPIITVQAFDTSNSNNRFAVIESVTTTNVNLTIRNHDGSAKDASFNFLAIGER